VARVRTQSFPDACSSALALYVLRRVQVVLRAPGLAGGLLEGLLTVTPFREFLPEQQAEIARLPGLIALLPLPTMEGIMPRSL
jgi:hypothetical protein